MEEYHFIELKKFTKNFTKKLNKDVNKLHSICDKWIYFLSQAKELETPPQELEKSKPLVKAFHILDRSHWTKEDLEMYEKIVDARRVEQSKLKTAKQEGKLEVAKNMISKGIPIQTICECTGLKPEEVEALR